MIEQVQNKVVYVVLAENVFAFPYRIFDVSDINVYLETDTGSVKLVYDVDYTVAALPDPANGAEITLNTGTVNVPSLPTGRRLAIQRIVPYTQKTSLPLNGKLPSTALETQLDHIVAGQQQLAEKLDRAVKVDPVSSETPEQLRDRLLATGASAASSAEAAAASEAAASGYASSASGYAGNASGYAGSASAAASAASAARDEAREAVTREQILEYASGSAYAALTCLVYNGGGYQVTSDTVAGENPDNTPGKFRCFASAGATIVGISEQVTSLTSGAIVVTRNAVPVALKTSSGKFMYLEKGTITISGGAWVIDPAAYLAYAKESAFAGPWTVYYAGGVPDSQPIVIGSGGAVVLHENQVYQVALTSGAVISVNSSGLTSSVCVTQELWIDMPSTAVRFSLPGLTWIDGIVPDFAAGNTRYVLTVRWNGTKFLANSAYEESLA